jgi:hypothetical protein
MHLNRWEHLQNPGCGEHNYVPKKQGEWYNKPRWTKVPGTNGRRGRGWTLAGLERFGELQDMVYENRKLAVATGVEERLRTHFQKRKSKLKKKTDENIDDNPLSKRAKLLIMRNYDSEEEGTSDYGKTADK